MGQGQSVPAPASARSPAQVREGSWLTRLLRGSGYLARGWRFIFEHPQLLTYCLLPLAIAALVFGGLVVLLFFHYGDLVDLIWARPGSLLLRLLWYLAYVFIFLLVMLLAYGSFFVVQSLLAAPFNDLLSERVEELVAGRTPPRFSLPRLGRTLGRTLLHQSAKLGIYLAVMLPLFLLSLVLPLLGPLLLLLGGGALTALFLGYDSLDLAMDRREWPFARKWRYLSEHRALVLGLGGLLEAALLVPVLGLLCLPASAVGATLLFCDLEGPASSPATPALSPPALPASPPEPPGPPPGCVV